MNATGSKDTMAGAAFCPGIDPNMDTEGVIPTTKWLGDVILHSAYSSLLVNRVSTRQAGSRAVGLIALGKRPLAGRAPIMGLRNASAHSSRC